MRIPILSGSGSGKRKLLGFTDSKKGEVTIDYP